MRDALHSIRWAFWLGWQVESNWTNPWRFAVYLLVKPFTGSLMLVAMYWAASRAVGAAIASGYLGFLYVSNASYMLVGAVAFGMSWAVVSDREHYGMLKYICLSPARLECYLIGRGLAKGAEGAVGAFLTLLLGWLLLPELRATLHLASINWLVLAANLALGVPMLLGLGLIVAGTVLNMTRHGMFLSEGVAGSLYLLCGVVFPIDVLPASLRVFSLALPPTYWLEGMRRALLGSGMSDSLMAWEASQLLLATIIGSLSLLGVGHLAYRWGECRAWRLGRFDISTG